jgi:C4-dicarboxylate transporter/malic acid transport protein
MSTAILTAPTPAAPVRPARLASFGPNWFAAVMGTGIIANAAMLLPVRLPALHGFAVVMWLLAAGLLVVLLVTSARHLVRHREVALGHHRSLTMAPFYGTVAMALLTVGSGAMLAGSALIGPRAALVIDATLWTLGTAGGLLCAMAIPYLVLSVHRPGLQDVSCSWLLPVVPPVVSATAGTGLVPHLSGQLRLTVELICGAGIGISVLMASAIIVLLWARLARHGVGPAQMVPSLWLVLGPLGSSVTAVLLLAHAAASPVLMDLALDYSVPVWGFAIAWMTIAAAITLRTARRGLSFSLAWWAFTFPVGTVITATSELALHTHAIGFIGVAVSLFAGLLVAWTAVAWQTARGVVDGSLFV